MNSTRIFIGFYLCSLWSRIFSGAPGKLHFFFHIFWATCSCWETPIFFLVFSGPGNFHFFFVFRVHAPAGKLYFFLIWFFSGAPAGNFHFFLVFSGAPGNFPIFFCIFSSDPFAGEESNFFFNSNFE